MNIEPFWKKKVSVYCLFYALMFPHRGFFLSGDKNPDNNEGWYDSTGSTGTGKSRQ